MYTEDYVFSRHLAGRRTVVSPRAVASGTVSASASIGQAACVGNVTSRRSVVDVQFPLANEASAR